MTPLNAHSHLGLKIHLKLSIKPDDLFSGADFKFSQPDMSQGTGLMSTKIRVRNHSPEGNTDWNEPSIQYKPPNIVHKKMTLKTEPPLEGTILAT